ncbi:MAG: acyl-CoA thioesterase [Bacteroidales bacterium]|nr:acyl-CoA thioesterase [Bacteroidales bacterium]
MHYETSFPVRYYETDQMGVVHHSNYIRYFECARNAMIADGGYPIEECEKDGVTIPVVAVECHYRRPALMGDVLKVTADIDRAPLAKLVIRQAVYNQRGEVCAEGQVTLGFLDKVSGRPVRCPDKLVKLIENTL